MLAAVAQIVGGLRANIVDVEHRRDLPGVALKSVRLDVSVETRDRAHADEIVNALEARGLPGRDRLVADDPGHMITVRLARPDEYARVGALTLAAYAALPVDHLWGGYDEEILDTAAAC